MCQRDPPMDMGHVDARQSRTAMSDQAKRFGALLLVAAAAQGFVSVTGCGSGANLPVAPSIRQRTEKLPQTEHLTDLLTAAGLEWAVLAKPQRLGDHRWLLSSIGPVLRDDRLDLLAQTTGIDMRRVRSFVLASYRPAKHQTDGTVAYFVRHDVPALRVERKFRERLTSESVRAVDGHGLVRLSGKIGTGKRGFANIGQGVTGFQFGGDHERGPMRIATMYARGRLTSVPTLLADDDLLTLYQSFDDPLVSFLLPGPFEGKPARGVRGLLAPARAAGVAIAATERQTLRLQITLVGNYNQPVGADPTAAALLELAWRDLQQSDLGHLLSLHAPVSSTETIQREQTLSLAVELDAQKLFRGLAAATIANVPEMMR